MKTSNLKKKKTKNTVLCVIRVRFCPAFVKRSHAQSSTVPLRAKPKRFFFAPAAGHTPELRQSSLPVCGEDKGVSLLCLV